MEYTGAQDAACYKQFVPTVGTSAVAPDTRPMLRQRLAPVAANGFYALPAGYRTVSLYDASGRMVWSYHRDDAGQAASIPLPENMTHGLWQATVMP